MEVIDCIHCNPKSVFELLNMKLVDLQMQMIHVSSPFTVHNPLVLTNITRLITQSQTLTDEITSNKDNLKLTESILLTYLNNIIKQTLQSRHQIISSGLRPK